MVPQTKREGICKNWKRKAPSSSATLSPSPYAKATRKNGPYPTPRASVPWVTLTRPPLTKPFTSTAQRNTVSTWGQWSKGRTCLPLDVLTGWYGKAGRGKLYKVQRSPCQGKHGAPANSKLFRELNSAITSAFSTIVCHQGQKLEFPKRSTLAHLDI